MLGLSLLLVPRFGDRDGLCDFDHRVNYNYRGNLNDSLSNGPRG